MVSKGNGVARSPIFTYAFPDSRSTPVVIVMIQKLLSDAREWCAEKSAAELYDYKPNILLPKEVTLGKKHILMANSFYIFG